MRRLSLALALALALATAFTVTPASAAEPQQTATQQASSADIARLLEVMDMRSMMDSMLKQMSEVQEATITQAFGSDLSDKDRAEMSDFMRRTNAKVHARLSWDRLEPLFSRVYTQLFSKREVDAMIAFYGSAEGQSILKKSPQAMAITMQEIQPIATAAMTEAMSVIEKRIAEQKKRKD